MKDSWVEDAASDAGVRERLVAAAGEHFSKFGYEKTTLAELAKSIGFSKTYFYRFFRSKQEIGEAVCSQCLGKILAEIEVETAATTIAAEKLRKMLRIIPLMGKQFFFQERRLYDVASISSSEGWSSTENYRARLAETLRQIIQDGRESGEFERKTPIDEVVRAILLSMLAYIDPNLLQHQIDSAAESSGEVIALILRSLSP